MKVASQQEDHFYTRVMSSGEEIRFEETVGNSEFGGSVETDAA